MAVGGIVAVAYAALYLTIGDVFLPYGPMFGLLILWKASHLGGFILWQVTSFFCLNISS